jgi:queuine tRNA-ribosyltransferase
MDQVIGNYKLEAQSGEARAGSLMTARGVVQTPIFMPVGTKGTVKAMLPEELKDMGAQIILGNTYHLHLRPGEATVKQLGGLHKFMNWPGPILTDSGGFQVFSLSNLNKVTEEGVEFRSHVDGAKLFLSPEVSMQIQMDLDADIIMAFDECLPHPSPREKIIESIDLTERWLRRSKAAMTDPKKLLFGIIQGGLDVELRRKSMAQITALDMPLAATAWVSLFILCTSR